MRAAGVILLGVVACGYDVTPVDLDLETTTSAGVSTRVERGTADPAASELGEGIMLWARWAVADGETRSAELWVDFSRDSLPETITPPERPVTLAAAHSLRIAATYRDRDGKLVTQAEATSATLSVIALAPHDARFLSSGWFEASWPEGEGLYTEVRGTWQTVPPPASFAPELPDRDPGDAAGDPVASDPGPPPGAGPDEGCGCGGGQEEKTPTPADHDEGGDADQGDADGDGAGEGDADGSYEGCGCGGDEAGDAGSAEEGCGCEGDTSDPEPSDSDGGGDSDQSGDGCCGGDPEPSPSDADRLSARQPAHRCYKSPLRHLVSVSPLLGFYLLARRRRR